MKITLIEGEENTKAHEVV